MPTVTLYLLDTKQVEVGGRYGKRTEALSRYEVRLDAIVVGGVQRRMITRERRTPGKRYVNARWQSPGWVYASTSERYLRGVECYSRRDGVERLLTDIGQPWHDARDLAKAAKVVKPAAEKSPA